MKKIICLIILFISLISTSGCVTLHEKFQRVDDIENISYIEFYFINFSYDSYMQNIPDSFQPIKTLEKNLYKEIIEDLEFLDYESTLLIFAASDPNFDLYGFIIKIAYDSGVYQLIGNSGTVYTYDNDDIVDGFHGTVKDEVWSDFIIKYLGNDIFDQYKLPF